MVNKGVDAAAERPRRTRLTRADRAEQILDAAGDEFGSVGYGVASVAAIAARAGVSKGLVLNYFGTKSALHAAVAVRVGQRIVDGIEPVVRSGLPALSMARSTLDAIFVALGNRPQDWNVLHDLTAPADSPQSVEADRIRMTIVGQAHRGVQALHHPDPSLDDEDLELLTEVWIGIVSSTVAWWIRHPGLSVEEMTRRSTRAMAAATHNREDLS